MTPVAIEESHSTLRFARSAKLMKNKPVINEVMNDKAIISKYEKRIRILEKELEQKNQLESHIKLRDNEIQALRGQLVGSIRKADNAPSSPSVKRRRETFFQGPAGTVPSPRNQFIKSRLTDEGKDNLIASPMPSLARKLFTLPPMVSMERGTDDESTEKAQLEEEVERLQQALQSSQAKNMKLTSDLKELEDMCTEMGDRMQDHIDEQDTEIESLSTQLDSSESQRKEAQAKLAEFESVLIAAGEEREDMVAQLRDKEERVRQAEARNTLILQEAEEHRAELESRINELMMSCQENTVVSSPGKKRKSTISEYHPQDIEDLKADLAVRQDEIKRLQADYLSSSRAAQEKYDALDQQLISTQRELELVQHEQTTQHTARITELEDMVASLENSSKQKNEEFDMLQRLIQEQEKIVSQAMQQEIDDLKSAVVDAEKERTALYDQMESLKAERDRLSCEKQTESDASHVEASSDLVEVVAQKDKVISDLRTDQERLTGIVTDCNKTIAEMESRHSELKEEIGSLNCALEQKLCELNDAEDKLIHEKLATEDYKLLLEQTEAKHVKEMESVKSANSEALENSVTEKDQAIASLRSELEAAATKLTEIAVQMKEMEQELEEKSCMLNSVEDKLIHEKLLSVDSRLLIEQMEASHSKEIEKTDSVLKDALKEKDQAIAALQSELDLAIAKQLEMETRMKDIDMRLQEERSTLLKDSQEKLNDQHIAFENSNKLLIEQIESKHANEIETANTANSEVLKHALTEKDQAIAALREQLDSAIANHDATTLRTKEMEKQLDQEIAALRSQLDTVIADNHELKVNEKEIKKVLEESSTNEKETKKLLEEKSTMLVDIEAQLTQKQLGFSEQMALHSAVVSASQTVLAERDSVIENLRSELEAASATIANRAELQLEVDGLKSLLESRTSEFQEVKDRLAQQCEQLKSDISSKSSQMSNLEDELKLREEAVSEANLRLEEVMVEHKSVVSEAQSRLNVSQHCLSSVLNHESDVEKVEKLGELLSDKIAEVSSLEQTVANLNSDLKRKTDEYAELLEDCNFQKSMNACHEKRQTDEFVILEEKMRLEDELALLRTQADQGSDLQNQITDLKAQLKSQSDALTQVTLEYEEKLVVQEKKCHSLTMKLAEEIKAKRGLRNDCDEIMSSLQKKDREIKEREEELREVQRRLEEQTGTVCDDSTVQQLEAAIAQRDQELSQQVEELQIFARHIEQMKGELESQQQLTLNQAAEVSELKSALENVSQERDEAAKAVEELTPNLELLKEEKSKLNLAMVGELQGKVDCLVLERDTLNATVTKLQSQIMSLEEKQSVDDGNSPIQQQVPSATNQDLETAISQHELELRQRDQEINQKTEELKFCARHIEQMQEEQGALQQTVLQSEAEITELKSVLENISQERDEAAKTAEELQLNLELLEEEKSKLELVEELQNKVNSLVLERDALNATVTKLQSKITELESKSSSTATSEEFELMRQQLLAANEKLDSMSLQVKQLECRKNELTSSKAKLELEVAELQQTVLEYEMMKSDYIQFKTSYDSLQQQKNLSDSARADAEKDLREYQGYFDSTVNAEKAKYQRLEDVNCKLTEEIENFKNTLVEVEKDCKVKVEQVNSEKHVLSEKLKDFSGQLSKQREEIAILTERTESLGTKLKDEVTKIEKLEAKKVSDDNDFLSLQNQYNAMCDEADSIEAKYNALDEKFQTLKLSLEKEIIRRKYVEKVARVAPKTYNPTTLDDFVKGLDSDHTEYLARIKNTYKDVGMICQICDKKRKIKSPISSGSSCAQQFDASLPTRSKDTSVISSRQNVSAFANREMVRGASAQEISAAALARQYIGGDTSKTLGADNENIDPRPKSAPTVEVESHMAPEAGPPRKIAPPVRSSTKEDECKQQ